MFFQLFLGGRTLNTMPSENGSRESTSSSSASPPRVIICAPRVHHKRNMPSFKALSSVSLSGKLSKCPFVHEVLCLCMPGTACQLSSPRCRDARRQEDWFCKYDLEPLSRGAAKGFDWGWRTLLPARPATESALGSISWSQCDEVL